MGPGRFTLGVGLRSALLDGARARVFVGAGIVEGSEAEAEWLETERKARAMLPALGVTDG
jgi:isochorismate synthase EntC